jgi:type I restriction enzyme, R subunit
MTISANFRFLTSHDFRLETIGGQAERYFRDDPSTTIGKLRQFAELLIKLIAAHHAEYSGERETFEETLRRLCDRRIIPRETANAFHTLRRLGNDAVHEAKGSHSDALKSLKFARQLGIWFHRTYGRQPNFNPGPFVPPSSAADATEALTEEVAALRRKISHLADAAAAATRQAEEQSRALETAEERLRLVAEERATWEQLAQESEAARFALVSRLKAYAYLEDPRETLRGRLISPNLVASASRGTMLEKGAGPILDKNYFSIDAFLATLQTVAAAAPEQQIVDLLQRGVQAAAKIDLDEPDPKVDFDDADTRNFIAQQLPHIRGQVRGPQIVQELRDRQRQELADRLRQELRERRRQVLRDPQRIVNAKAIYYSGGDRRKTGISLWTLVDAADEYFFGSEDKSMN